MTKEAPEWAVEGAKLAEYYSSFGGIRWTGNTVTIEKRLGNGNVRVTGGKQFRCEYWAGDRKVASEAGARYSSRGYQLIVTGKPRVRS